MAISISIILAVTVINRLATVPEKTNKQNRATQQEFSDEEDKTRDSES